MELDGLSISFGMQKIHSTVFYLFTYPCDVQYYQIGLLYLCGWIKGYSSSTTDIICQVGIPVCSYRTVIE